MEESSRAKVIHQYIFGLPFTGFFCLMHEGSEFLMRHDSLCPTAWHDSLWMTSLCDWTPQNHQRSIVCLSLETKLPIKEDFVKGVHKGENPNSHANANLNYGKDICGNSKTIRACSVVEGILEQCLAWLGVVLINSWRTWSKLGYVESLERRKCHEGQACRRIYFRIKISRLCVYQ